MKKKYIIIAIVVFVILVGVALFLRTTKQSLPFTTHAITFRVQQPDLTVDLFRQSDTSADRSSKIDSFSSTKTLNLNNGTYYYIASGKNSAPETITFSVVNDLAIDVNPSYTTTYLSSLVDSQLGQINAAIAQAYPLTTNGYTINKGRLFFQGQWYATTISDKRNSNKNPFDVYRIVLLNENGVWRTMTTPEISLSTVTNSGIPRIILSTINKVDPLSDTDPGAVSNPGDLD